MKQRRNKKSKKALRRELAVLRERENEERICRYQEENGLRGFFRIPWMKRPTWCSQLQVQKFRARECFLEWGCMSYVAGETIFNWDRRTVGEYYPYRRRGEHDHEHWFFAVLAEAVGNGGQVEAETEGGYYADWMLSALDRVRQDKALRDRLRSWALKPWISLKPVENVGLGQPPIPCLAGGEERTAGDVEELYGLAAQYPRGFTLLRPELCSAGQRQTLAAILEYQLWALEGQGEG